MKLGLRIFLGSMAIFAACVSLPIHWMWSTLRTRYLESVEVPLVDTANILASLFEDQLGADDFDPKRLQAAFERAHARNPGARIYDLEKTTVDLRVYATDTKGKVVFDTRHPPAVGEDYSRWRDVELTLAGQYGARATRTPPEQHSSVLYVAAPMYRDGSLSGVLTVGEPTASIQAFLDLAWPPFLQAALLSLAAATLLSLALSYVLTRPIHRLTLYADAIGAGGRMPFPDLGRTEIADLGMALRRMQEALEGRRYAEQYVQTLTHELKSPLSAIRGAAELLHDDMPREQQERFVDNIRGESERISRIVERMLELATLENRREKPEMAPVDLGAMINTVVEAQEPELAIRDVRLNKRIPERAAVVGNSFLLHQAISNLVQNAVDFGPRGGTIDVTVTVDFQHVTISVGDQGPGVPEYARNRIFDRFYSLARPDTGRKSTGLGLNFVREVAQLHGGEIHLTNRSAGGALAELVLPVRSTS